jgi:hypothetical protein
MIALCYRHSSNPTSRRIPLVDTLWCLHIKVTRQNTDRLCGIVIRILDYRSGGPGSIPALPDFLGRGGRKEKKTVVGLERGPLSLVSTTEELLDRKVAAPV